MSYERIRIRHRPRRHHGQGRPDHHLTDTSNAGEHILENLADAIHAKMAEKEITSEQVEGVGIGVPGPVLDSRVVPIICANLGGWGERNVSAQLSGLLDGMKVLVGNDANVAALGEIWMGTATSPSTVTRRPPAAAASTAASSSIPAPPASSAA